MAMGDALAVALMKARNFRSEDFAQFHPGGSLGRKLLTTVETCMYTHNLPKVSPVSTIKKVINEMSSGRLGLAIVIDKGIIKGIITDGDLRRAMDKYESKLFVLKASDIMTKNPKVISKTTMMAKAEEMMSEYKITSLLVGQKGRLDGVVQIYTMNK
jgi:arabinose-5-phosphate isomerase